MKYLLFVLGVLSTFAFIDPVNAHGPRQKFCSTWLSLCKQTSPGPQGPGVCASRHSSCLSSGCFHFNNPGPRCETSAEDKSVTQRVNECLRNGKPVGFGRCT